MSAPAQPEKKKKSRKGLKIVGLALGVVILGLGTAAWSMLRVEEIPEELEQLDPEVAIADLTLSAQGPMPAVRLGDLKGKKVFLLIEGRESMSGGEGRLLRRALHRWVLPEDVLGYSVGEAPAGAAVMKGKIENEFVGPMRDELRWPIYVDFGGDMSGAFSLPQGHLGLVILDEQGEVLLRHAGDADEAKIEEIRVALGASEPEPGPPAPAFTLGELDAQRCAEQRCVLVFLDETVARSDIPGLKEGGFEGDMQASFKQIKKPSVRLASILAGDWGEQRKEHEDELQAIAGVVVGEGVGWEVEGWPFVADEGEAAAVRGLFGIAEGQAAMVIIDHGKQAFVAEGRIPFWKLSLAADVLGLEAREGRRKRDGDDDEKKSE
ncbi:MAG: hypothetical protein KC457_15805 [Myxococcales bacterium]|nr:hypothetical protein [Myxococcales bacterium]